MTFWVALFRIGASSPLTRRTALLLITGAISLCCSLALGQSTTPAAPVRSVQGMVKSGKFPVPGATVTAVNHATGQKVVGWTRPDGSFKLTLRDDGEYVVRAQMSAFATSTARVTVGPSNQNPHVDLEMVLLSRSESAQGGAQARAGAAGNRGFQSLSVFQGEGGSDQAANDSVAPSGVPVPGIPPTVATESVAVTGTSSPSLAGLGPDELRASFGNNPLGGVPGAGGGPPGGGGGFGGRGGGGFGGGGRGGGGGGRFGGRGSSNQIHGTIYYSANDAALNAAPYSLTGEPSPNPAYLQQRFGGNVGGPLIIPHLYNGSKTFFFIHYNGTLGSTPFSYYSTVPTLAERAGNFSQTLVNGQPIQIYDPATGQPFVNDLIPPGMISPAAQGLLKYIPLPNLPGTVQNFRFVTAAEDDTNDLNIRLNQALGAASARGPGRFRGPQNNLTFAFHYSEGDQTLTNSFPSVGGQAITHGYDVPIGYVRSFGRLINTLRVEYNLSQIDTQNLYANSNDITGDLGINGVSTNPSNWGLPNLSFTNFAGLSDTLPVDNRDQTVTLADQMLYTHGKHTLRWGGDFRRIELNTRTASNPRGSFVFTGLNTAEMVNGSPVPGTGFDFADFLLGLPQQTSVQYGTNPSGYHFRGNSWDLYAQDEWRARANLSFNIGLRYEYVSPYSETANQLVNLDIAPGLAAVAPVLPGQIGPLTGTSYPVTLVNADHHDFAPRVGVAWKWFSNTVVRAGYGINYNTTAYANIAQDLAFQPPFSFTQTNVESLTNHLTLTNGFPIPPVNTITNNYAVNVNYPLGYVQIWNLDLQQTITPTLVLNLDYTGTKGTHLDLLDAPNRTPLGLLNPAVPAFYYENPVADSNANAGTVRFRKRLSHGMAIGGTYTWSKSLDDASTIGAGSAVVSPNGTVTGTTLVAQNPFNLKAEYGLSSFDQRNKFTADYLWELPFGHEKRWLSNSGLARDFLGDWQWSGDWTIASGFPFTPRILGEFGNVNSGVNGTLRPDLTGEPIALANPTIEEWFNVGAFVLPPTGQYGNAGRNSIEGPGEVIFDMAMTKVFPLPESRFFEVRASATNVFNHPQFTTIDTVVNSPTFGRVTAVGAMRALLMTARFRF
ncbi:MAG TPA: TonB-dependent receptor [Bryocella sp.]|nr:TonB-dependent receptor [Bryocella sp.]